MNNLISRNISSVLSDPFVYSAWLRPFFLSAHEAAIAVCVTCYLR